MYNKDKKESINFIIQSIIILFAIFQIVGFGSGLIYVNHYKDICKYRSIVSRINVGYILGCEMGRNRF